MADRSEWSSGPLRVAQWTLNRGRAAGRSVGEAPPRRCGGPLAGASGPPPLPLRPPLPVRHCLCGPPSYFTVPPGACDRLICRGGPKFCSAVQFSRLSFSMQRQPAFANKGQRLALPFHSLSTASPAPTTIAIAIAILFALVLALHHLGFGVRRVRARARARAKTRGSVSR